MKRSIVTATSLQSAGDTLIECLAEYIGSGLSVDILQLRDYPREKWAKATYDINRKNTYAAVEEFMQENFEGWFNDEVDTIFQGVWSYLENSPDFDLTGEDSDD